MNVHAKTNKLWPHRTPPPSHLAHRAVRLLRGQVPRPQQAAEHFGRLFHPHDDAEALRDCEASVCACAGERRHLSGRVQVSKKVCFFNLGMFHLSGRVLQASRRAATFIWAYKQSVWLLYAILIGTFIFSMQAVYLWTWYVDFRYICSVPQQISQEISEMPFDHTGIEFLFAKEIRSVFSFFFHQLIYLVQLFFLKGMVQCPRGDVCDWDRGPKDLFISWYIWTNIFSGDGTMSARRRLWLRPRPKRQTTKTRRPASRWLSRTKSRTFSASRSTRHSWSSTSRPTL